MLLAVAIVACNLLLVLLTIIVLIITYTRLYTRLRHIWQQGWLRLFQLNHSTLQKWNGTCETAVSSNG